MTFPSTTHCVKHWIVLASSFKVKRRGKIPQCYWEYYSQYLLLPS